MSILPKLFANKGTVSSFIGKQLAEKVFKGSTSILNEAIDLFTHDSEEIGMKIVRSGAAKIVEIVAEQRPELVAPNLA